MLRDGDFALEVTMFETGVPPEFRLYAYRGEQPLAPSVVSASDTDFGQAATAKLVPTT